MVRYVTKSNKCIHIQTEKDTMLYPNDEIELFDLSNRQSYAVETVGNNPLKFLPAVWLFIKCFLLAIIRIVLQDSGENWVKEIDPFIIGGHANFTQGTNCVKYTPAQFADTGVLLTLPKLEVNDVQITDKITIDYNDIHEKFLYYCFNFCSVCLYFAILMLVLMVCGINSENLLLIMSCGVLLGVSVILAIIVIFIENRKKKQVIGGLKKDEENLWEIFCEKCYVHKLREGER